MRLVPAGLGQKVGLSFNHSINRLYKYSRNNDPELAEKAIKTFIVSPLEFGWDQQHGGVLYFLDAEGFCPTALEWDMKLWC